MVENSLANTATYGKEKEEGRNLPPFPFPSCHGAPVACVPTYFGSMLMVVAFFRTQIWSPVE